MFGKTQNIASLRGLCFTSILLYVVFCFVILFGKTQSIASLHFFCCKNVRKFHYSLFTIHYSLFTIHYSLFLYPTFHLIRQCYKFLQRQFFRTNPKEIILHQFFMRNKNLHCIAKHFSSLAESLLDYSSK